MLTHERQQLGLIGGLAHHLETPLVEQAGQPLAQQDVLIGDDDVKRTRGRIAVIRRVGARL
jgi:hypothetical protein